MKDKYNNYNKIVNETIASITNQIENAFKKIPTIKIKSVPDRYHSSKIYDNLGCITIGREFESYDICLSTSTDASTPELGRPFYNHKLKFKFKVGDWKVFIESNRMTDSVPVNFMTHPKESKKNVTIGRKLANETEKKISKILSKLEIKLTDEQIEAFNEINELILEQELFRDILYTFRKMGYPGIRKEKRTYFDGNIKIGTEDALMAYLKVNKHLVRHFNEVDFPILYGINQIVV